MSDEPKNKEENAIEENKSECNCAKLQVECAEYKQGWQRALADYQNLQKEVAARRSELAQMSERQILEEFIPVYDHLKLAINNEQLTSDKNPWLEGVKHVARQFGMILKAHNVEEIKTVGEKFDARLHEAVGEEAHEPALNRDDSGSGRIQGKMESGTILREVEGGYKMGDRIIKPAKVIIIK